VSPLQIIVWFEACLMKMVCQILYNYSSNWFCSIQGRVLIIHMSLCQNFYIIINIHWWYSYYQEQIVVVLAFKNVLKTHFWIKDLGNVKYFRNFTTSIVISQWKYTLEILKDCGFLGVKPVNFPMEQNLKLSESNDMRKYPSWNRQLVGRLIYLTITWLDITYSVNVLRRFMNAPCEPHVEAILRVMRYLKNSPGQGLFFHT